MDYWREFQQKWLGYVPLFLLTLGCGIDSGRLMAVAFLCHLLICKKKKAALFRNLEKRYEGPADRFSYRFFVALCRRDPSFQSWPGRLAVKIYRADDTLGLSNFSCPPWRGDL